MSIKKSYRVNRHRPAPTSRVTGRVFIAVIAIAVSVSVSLMPTMGAHATEYPTWDDVAVARNDEAATQARIAEIQELLSGLQTEATRAASESEAKAALWAAADTKFQEAVSRAKTLQGQADTANAKADASLQRAGQVAAQLMRVGGNDTTMTLLLNPGTADDLLYGLGMSQKVAEQANAIYERARVDQNTAQALTDQANVAQEQLAEIRKVAEEAFTQAQSASEAAAAALNEQRNNEATLQQQLVVLSERRTATETDYLAGVRERVGSGASLDAGEISLSGWARPAPGYITSVYGWSEQYGTSFHKGIDLGFACGQNVYAASSGTVVFAAEGWNGGYGNYIILEHSNGVRTGYAHLLEGGVLVSAGQQVDVGQNIARGGTTGNSTGCHLHFEVRINGETANPATFMSDQGIALG
ncbi:MAG: peptidase M23 [Micrococcales bacterium 70-64]|nr:M23 family metallopeptidase [Leifsonia sp.]ODU63951.1 MAG: peptidase M23 [Leifsonia sp. SCN 70-46]OJX85642.1 MAG: peptidase M23 [Micrococcales bacterium 70-64]